MMLLTPTAPFSQSPSHILSLHAASIQNTQCLGIRNSKRKQHALAHEMLEKSQSRQKQNCPNSEDLEVASSFIVGNLDSSIEKATTWQMMDLVEAIDLLDNMTQPPSIGIIISILQKCRKEKNLPHAKHIYAYLCRNGLGEHKAIGNYIVPMFVDCGSISDAQQAFSKLGYRNEHSWTSLISGYIESGRPLHAFNLYEKMRKAHIKPSRYTLTALLKACTQLRDAKRGRGIHSEIIQKGFETDVYVGSTLIDMYAKCNSIFEAQQVFEELPVRNVVSWTALIAGYTEHGLAQEALKCLEKMQMEGVTPNAVTYICSLRTCSNIQAIEKGRELHEQIKQKGLDSDPFVGNSLVDMYSKCGSLSDAQDIFDKLPVRDVVTWTALIAGYAEHGPGQEALRCFEQMQLDGVCPNFVTYICALKACGNTGAVEKGQEMHAAIVKQGMQGGLFIGSSLIDMYAKCGLLSEARGVFDNLPVQDVVSWSGMINAYGMNHEGDKAIQCFEEMQKQNVEPNSVTFTCLLTACSCNGLVIKGKQLLRTMREEYGIVPTIDHYTCTVDLLSRAGYLCEAVNFVERMPCSPTIEIWTALLSGCKIHNQIEIGYRCFKEIVQINPNYAASYVLMGSIYASAGRSDDAYRIEDLRRRAGAQKKPAIALIEVKKKLHEFVVGNNEDKEISSVLEGLSSRMKEEGHVSNLDLVLRPVSNEEKEAALCGHAERLAVAFGILNTPPGQTLRVTKNLRMCINCHSANKVISKIERREIIVRDSYSIHHFKDGLCSCRDVV